MFCQVMPLFGDMKMKPFDTYVKNSVHFNANKWPLSNSSTTSNQVDSPGKGLKVVMYVTFSRPTSCTILRKCDNHNNTNHMYILTNSSSFMTNMESRVQWVIRYNYRHC